MPVHLSDAKQVLPLGQYFSKCQPSEPGCHMTAQGDSDGGCSTATAAYYVSKPTPQPENASPL